MPGTSFYPTGFHILVSDIHILLPSTHQAEVWTEIPATHGHHGAIDFSGVWVDNQFGLQKINQFQ